MTELQIGLIALGAAAIVGVLGYNKWQENRHRKLAEAVFQPEHDDVLLSETPAFQRSDTEMSVKTLVAVTASRIEPVFAPLDAAQIEMRNPAAEPAFRESPSVESFLPEKTREPSIKTALATPPVSEARFDLAELEETADDEMPEVPAALLDARTEFMVAMELVDLVPATQILNSQRETLQSISKPVHWVAYNERSREWGLLTPDSEQAVRRLRVGLQLVNRLGPVSDSELVIFTGAMQVLADELMAVAMMPTTRVRDQATELDAFCAAVDLEIGINLISKGTAFSGTKIRALAEAAGMVLGVDGLFTRYDDAGRAQFCLQNFETAQFAAESIRTMATHGLTFLLDVPRVDHGERVFLQMTELAKRFAETLHGVLVDDNRAPLGEPQLDHIRREFVGKPQAAMVAFGLAAGSPQALRLFS
jgi:FtsZ-interacting cell division protein ZipA